MIDNNKQHNIKSARFIRLIVVLCCLSLLSSFHQVWANLSANNELVVKVSGFGLSEKQAKLNAYENFIIKIFNKDALKTLNYNDPLLLDEASFLTDAMRQIVLGNIDYVVSPRNSELYRGEVKLRRAKFNQIYDFILPRISVDIIDLNSADRQTATLESIQLAMLLYHAYQQSSRDIDHQKLKKALSRVDYYLQKDSTGLVVFPLAIFTQAELRINDTLVHSNEIFLPQGKHHFTLNQEGYFPVLGYFYLKKGDIKKIPVAMIKKPEIAVPIAITSNFSNELLRYNRHILESYGWSIDQNSRFVIEGFFSHRNESLKNNFIQRKVKITFRFGDNGAIQKNGQPFIAPSTTAMYEQEYENEFIYSENDLGTLARQQRLLFIKSLLSFLSNFDQQDYHFVHSQQAQ